MAVSLVLPLLQLIILGYAFGGKLHDVPVALVDLDHLDNLRPSWVAASPAPGDPVAGSQDGPPRMMTRHPSRHTFVNS